MSNRLHKRSSWGTKGKREHDKRVEAREARPPKHTTYESKRKGPIPEHDIAVKYNCTWHAVRRYAERIFGMTEDEAKYMDQEKGIQIARSIRETLPEHILSETRYNILDNYYAVVNGGMIVTITKVGR